MPITHFQPPDPPEIPPAPIPPALNKGTGTRSIGDRLRFWRALAGLGLALGAVPYVTWKALAGGWPVADVLWWAIVVAGLLGVGVAWVGLTFAQDWAQFRAMRTLWWQQLNDLAETAATQRAALQGHTDRWGGKRTPRAKKTRWVKVEGRLVRMTEQEYQTHLTQQQATQAAQQAQAARAEVGVVRDSLTVLDAQIAAVLAASKARVSSPPENAPDLDTRELPQSGPVAAAYYGGPAHRIVAMALRHESISVRALVPRWMTRAQHDAAKAQLSGAGVLVKEGQGVALAADLMGLGEDTCHARVVARLTTAPADSPPPPTAAQ